MGLFDVFRLDKISRTDRRTARTALDEAQGGHADADAITRLIQRVLSVGLDGRGFFKGSAAVADAAWRRAGGDVERAVSLISSDAGRTATAGGFATNLGGFVTMTVAIPANVFEFYVLATRAVGAIAVLRGYDVRQPTVRTAVLLTLVGSRATDILKATGVTIGTGGLGSLADIGLPKAAGMLINKAVGFQVLRAVGEKTLTHFGRAVPVLGGVIGAVADGAMMSWITRQARREFPVHHAPRDWGVR